MEDPLYRCTTDDHIYELSNLCTNGSDISAAECVKDIDSLTKAIRYFTGSWCVMVAFLGIFGNLATFLSIPFAAKRKLHGLDEKFRTTHIFIVHLSFIDLCYCLCFALPQSFSFFINYWPFGTILKKASYTAGLITSVADLIAVASISISRCLDLTRTNFWQKCSDNWFALLLMLSFPWLLVIFMWTILVVLQPYGFEVGWDCVTGMCGLMPLCNQTKCNEDEIVVLSQTTGPYVIAFYSPMFLSSSFSYFIIWKKVRSATVELIRMGNTNIDLHEREVKMTKTILLLVLTNLICTVPPILLLYTELGLYIPRNVAYLINIVYNTQYAFNLFIYAVKSDQYRKAYLDYWNYLTCHDKRNNRSK